MTPPYPAGEPGPSSFERVIEDEQVRLWSVCYIGEPAGDAALLFSCVSEPRESPRALAVNREFELGELSEETLRHLLHLAPPLGYLA